MLIDRSVTSISDYSTEYRYIKINSDIYKVVCHYSMGVTRTLLTQIFKNDIEVARYSELPPDYYGGDGLGAFIAEYYEGKIYILMHSTNIDSNGDDYFDLLIYDITNGVLDHHNFTSDYISDANMKYNRPKTFKIINNTICCIEMNGYDVDYAWFNMTTGELNTLSTNYSDIDISITFGYNDSEVYSITNNGDVYVKAAVSSEGFVEPYIVEADIISTYIKPKAITNAYFNEILYAFTNTSMISRYGAYIWGNNYIYGALGRSINMNSNPNCNGTGVIVNTNIPQGIVISKGQGDIINIGKTEDIFIGEYPTLYINGIRTPFRKYNPDTGVWERLDNFFGEE